MVSLKQQVGGLTYDSPLVVSSSPLTDSVELIKKAEDNGAGAVSTKLTLLYQPTQGIRQMYAERGLFGFNCSDKRNDLEAGLRLVRGAKEATNLVIWSNISGFGGDLESWTKIAKAFEEAGADALELNLMCPNFSTAELNDPSAKRIGGMVGKDPVIVEQIVTRLKASVKIPIWCKPATEVMDYSAIARAVKNGGADGIVSNAAPLVAPPIDIYRGGRPKMATLKTCSFGGLTGPAIRQASYRCIATVAQNVDIPIAGGGGIEKWEHAIEAIFFGASLVTICTKLLWDGFSVLKDIRQGMVRFMEENGYETVDQMRGLALQYLVPNDKIENQLGYSVINIEKCGGCGICSRIGSCTAITVADKKASVDKQQCCGCGLCWALCPSHAISFSPVAR
jgi:dihydroorotate dehydrogenase subfamily 1